MTLGSRIVDVQDTLQQLCQPFHIARVAQLEQRLKAIENTLMYAPRLVPVWVHSRKQGDRGVHDGEPFRCDDTAVGVGVLDQ